MKSGLASLESNLESAEAHEKLLLTDVTRAKTLQKDAEENLENLVEQRDLWIKSMVDIAECLTSQIAKMDMKSWAYSVGKHEAPSINLTLFFDGLIEGLKTYEEDRAASFANESRKLARDALFLVLSNLAFFHPELDLSDGFKKLPSGADTSAATEKAVPLSDRILKVSRTQGSHRS